jgi:enoyl-CoA hydratase/carnithine racemase
MEDAVLIEARGPIRILTLNRPDSLNAFTDEMHRELPRALRDVDDDPDARAVVLTGAGRAFSAGGNLDDFERYAKDLQARRHALRGGRRLFEDLISMQLPVVAAVNGPAVGLGCTIAAACDMVFISAEAYLADPHIVVALVAGDGSAATWPLNAGMLRAKEFLLTGDRIRPEDAVRIGMANRVVPPDEVLPQAVAWAEKLAALPWQAVQDTKVVLNQLLKQAAVATLGFGLAAESQSHETPEYRAAPERFRSRER